MEQAHAWLRAVCAVPTAPINRPNQLHSRKPKENNFKAVLESIRDLMNEDVIIPPWLHDIFLGYGDPGESEKPV